MVEIYDDRLEITSPGGLPKGLRSEDFGKVSVLRNPNLANLMQRVDYIEKMGTGIPRVQKLLAEAGNEPLRYEFSGFVRAVFRRHNADTTQETEDTTQEIILSFIKKTPEITRKELAEQIGLSSNGIKYHLDKLRKAGIIEHRGPSKRGYWVVLKE